MFKIQSSPLHARGLYTSPSRGGKTETPFKISQLLLKHCTRQLLKAVNFLHSLVPRVYVNFQGTPKSRGCF